MSADRIRVRALAKINVTLRVLGVRADGFHEIRTTFQSIALHDTLTVERARGPFRLTCSNPSCPVDRTNIVWRAAEAMWRAAGTRGDPRGVAVHLVKRIPMQAGLGGGSSDAAAALRAFGAMWLPRSRRVDLAAIASGLGADVPFFLEGGTALGVERGDVLFPLAEPPRSWVVVAAPPFGVSTKDAYGWWDAALDRKHDEGGNDFEALVTAHHPEIGVLVRQLERAGASRASMSGSGSAVFGLFSSRAAAERAARHVAGDHTSVAVTRTVNRSEYQRLAAPGLPR